MNTSNSIFRRINILWCRLRLKWAERAVERPFDTAASLRLDRAVIALEKALEARPC